MSRDSATKQIIEIISDYKYKVYVETRSYAPCIDKHKIPELETLYFFNCDKLAKEFCNELYKKYFGKNFNNEGFEINHFKPYWTMTINSTQLYCNLYSFKIEDDIEYNILNCCVWTPDNNIKVRLCRINFHKNFMIYNVENTHEIKLIKNKFCVLDNEFLKYSQAYDYAKNLLLEKYLCDTYIFIAHDGKDNIVSFDIEQWHDLKAV
jgi:hypothetical protein